MLALILLLYIIEGIVDYNKTPRQRQTYGQISKSYERWYKETNLLCVLDKMILFSMHHNDERKYLTKLNTSVSITKSTQS